MSEQLLCIKITVVMEKLKNKQRCGPHGLGAYDLIRDMGKKVNNYNTGCYEQ